MRWLQLCMLWLVVLGCGCQATETVQATTQVTLRVQCAEQALLEKASALRVSVWRAEAAGWSRRSSVVLPFASIRWPLDIPITPSSAAAAAQPFEVIVEALAGDSVLAEARAVAGYARGSLRVLELWLFECRAVGTVVCAAADCHGPDCARCSSEGTCIPVGSVDATTLPPYAVSEEPVVRPPPGHDGVDAAADAGFAAQPDAGNVEAGAPDVGVDASQTEAAVPTMDGCEPACGTTGKCMVQGGVARCVCLPGYQDQAGSCEDIDECKNGGGGCTAGAMCSNLPGSFSCGCGENYIDVKGDGSQCVDKCQGACDAHAACTIVSGKVNCQCTGAYTGNGTTCVLNPSCEALNCGVNSQCTPRPGSTNMYQCVCLAGFELKNGKCEDIDECALTPGTCGAGATCQNTAGSRTCSCNTGYKASGSTPPCTLVDCLALGNPLNGSVATPMGTTYNQMASYTCAGGFKLSGSNVRTCGSSGTWSGSAPTCGAILCPALSTDPANGNVSAPNRAVGQIARYTCNTGYAISSGNETRTCQEDGAGNAAWGGTAAVCSLACTINDSCQPGQACVADADCGSGNVCEASRCLLGSCPGGTITSATSLTHCKKINGDLTVRLSAAGAAQFEFPSTTEILGSLIIDAKDEISSRRVVTFGVLTRVSGNLDVGTTFAGNPPGLSGLEVSFPKLKQVELNLRVIRAMSLRVLSMPALTTVGGNWYMEYLDYLHTVQMGALQSVGGNEALALLIPNAPYTPTFSRLASVLGAKFQSLGIGCCLSSGGSPDCPNNPAPTTCQ